MKLYVRWIKQGQIVWEDWWVAQRGCVRTHIPTLAEHISFANYDLRNHALPYIQAELDGQLFIDLADVGEDYIGDVTQQILDVIRFHGFSEATSVLRETNERYLQMLQKSAGLTEVQQQALVRELVDFIKPGIEGFDLSVPDPLRAVEDLWQMLFLQPLLSRSSPADARRLQAVTFGFLPTQDANAWAVKVPSGGDLIVIHTALPRAFLKWFEVLAVEEAGGNRNHEHIRRGGIEFINAFMPGFLPFDPEPKLQLDDRQIAQSRLLAFGSVQFIIAHEYAHIYLGHTSPITKVLLGKNTEVSIASRKRGLELEADRQAFEWLREVNPFTGLIGSSFQDRLESAYGDDMKNVWDPSRWIDTLSFLCMIELCVGSPPSNASHPSALERMSYIASTCANWLTEKEARFKLD